MSLKDTTLATCRSAVRARGFSLIEAMVVIVVLALVVPSTVSMLTEATDARLDAISLQRATALAEGVLESVIGDVASPHPHLGFVALENVDTYLHHPQTGLVARLSAFAQPFTDAGLQWEVEISPLQNADGKVSMDPLLNEFRSVTVHVRFPLASRSSQTLSLTTVVCTLP